MSETKAASQEAESSLNNEMASRREKLEKLRAETRVAYPNDFRRDATAGDLHAKYDALSEEELEKSPVTVRIASEVLFVIKMCPFDRSWRMGTKCLF